MTSAPDTKLLVKYKIAASIAVIISVVISVFSIIYSHASGPYRLNVLETFTKSVEERVRIIEINNAALQKDVENITRILSRIESNLYTMKQLFETNEKRRQE